MYTSPYVVASCTLLPHQCVTATNLTQSWRTEYDGKALRGGGPDSYDGFACDLRSSLQWFRFVGEAGKMFCLFSLLKLCQYLADTQS